MSEKKTSYTPAPEVPEQVLERYRTMLRVLSGEMTVSEAARSLKLSRPRFLTLMHRGMGALVEAIAVQAPGRPARSEREKQLEEQNAKLQSENARLHRRTEMIDRILTVTTQLARGRAPSRPRSRKKATDKDDEEGARERLRVARELRALGMSASLSARVVGASASTLRRWERRARAGEALRGRRGPRSAPALSPERAQKVEEHVRALAGLVGAESLRHTVPGVSRRQASAVKTATLTVMERERVARCMRIRVAAPGIMRGFDAMHVSTRQGPRFLLIAGDACVPFRTSARVEEHYDAPSVAKTLDEDFREHGAPLVLRLDRARAHDSPEVHAVLRKHGVLMLHGPPRHPRFYGQLERQNREHRAWLEAEPQPDELALRQMCRRMTNALNDLWRRPTLEWRTACEVWEQRPPLIEDRDALRHDVDRAASEKCLHANDTTELRRFAIETVLTERQYLRREAGGWC